MGAGRLEQAPASHHDPPVGARQMLARPMPDRSDAFLDRRVLLAHAEHAGEASALLLGDAIDQVVVAPVRDRHETALGESYVDAAASVGALALLGCKRSARVVVDAEYQAVCVVHANPSVAAPAIAPL